MEGELFVVALESLQPTQLLRAACVCKHWRDCARDNSLWLAQCRHRWGTQALRYHLTSDRQLGIERSPTFSSWETEYWWAEQEGARHAITHKELIALTLEFRLRVQQDEAISSAFCFADDGFTSGHPSGRRLPWALNDDGLGVRVGFQDQTLRVVVRRCKDWSWRLGNQQVILSEIPLTATRSAFPDDSDDDVLRYGNSGRTIGADADSHGVASTLVTAEGPFVDLSDLPDEVEALEERRDEAARDSNGPVAMNIDGELFLIDASDLYY